MIKIGITGASGHVGANLLRMLLQQDYQVRVLQHNDHEALDGLSPEICKGSLDDPNSLTAFCDGLDVVVHLAARISIGTNSFDNLYPINVEGTKNLVYAAENAGVKKFIHFSSIHALEHEPLDQAMDERRPFIQHAKMPYERTKALAEEWICTRQSSTFDVIRLHPTAILGPYDFKPSFVGQFIIRLYNGTLPGLVRGGYDWVDVRDVCEATCNAIKKGKGGERYILSGAWLSVVGFARLFEQVTNKKVSHLVIPLWLARVGVPFIQFYSRLRGMDPLYTSQSLTILQNGNRHISSDKARKELGFNSRPLAQSIEDTVKWFKEAGKIK